MIGRLQEFTTRLQSGLGALDWSTRREVIRTLVKRIEIDHDKIEVVFRVPATLWTRSSPAWSVLSS